MYICPICKKQHDEPRYYWIYSQKKGFEVGYPVCEQCDKNANHAMYIVDQIQQKKDKRYV